MMHQIGLEMPGLGDVPGQAQHRDVAQQLASGLGLLARQSGLILSDATQAALHGGDADTPQLVQQHWGCFQFTVSRQMAGHLHQVGRQTLSTDVVIALVDDAQRVVNLRPVDSPTLGATPLAIQTAVHQADQGLAIQAGDRLHLIQESSFRLPVGLDVPLLHRP